MSTQNQFVVTVCNCFLRNTSTDAIVLKGKTLLSSALTQSVQNLEIKGGPGNQLLYDYSNEKKIEIKIEDAVWKEEYLALNSGVSIANGAKDFYIFDEAVTLVAGVGSVAQTPTGKVYVEKSDGTYVTITPNVKQIDLSDAAATSCKATYQYSTTVDSITLNGDDFPDSFELVMMTEIMGASAKLADLQIIVPQFKVSGNFEISFGASSAATSRLDGKALADADYMYAEVYILPVSSTIAYTQIAASPATVAVTVAAGDDHTAQLSVIGIRGGNYANVNLLAADCTFTSSVEAKASVGAHTGLITGLEAGDTVITIEHDASGLLDYVNVTVS
jgi:hypothetical protein